MPEKKVKKLRIAADKLADEHGVRYCTNCMQTKRVENGKWTVYDNGLRRRWKCAPCVAKIKARQDLKYPPLAA
jgi:hypothetical protein